MNIKKILILLLSLVLSIALFIWLLGSLIDVIRSYIFDRLKVKQHSSFVITYCLDKIDTFISTKDYHRNENSG